MGVGQHALASPLIRGVWTWARGGGWQGPYILGGGNGADGSNGGGAAGEFWEGINVFVVSQWVAARMRAGAPQPLRSHSSFTLEHHHGEGLLPNYPAGLSD